MYSTCQDTCPVTATTIRGALDDLGHDVPALAVSVDPAHDTPDSAEAFLVKRGLSARAHALPARHAGPARSRSGTTTASARRATGFEHSAYVLLIDKRGRQRISFPVDQLVDRDLAHDIRKLEARAAPRGRAVAARRPRRAASRRRSRRSWTQSTTTTMSTGAR